MSRQGESSATQAAMDKLFGIQEPRANIGRPAGYGDSQPGRNEVYSRALLEGRERFPNDGVAAHRFAEREAARIMQVRAAASTSPDSSQQIIDQALLDAFGEDSGGRGRLSHVQTFPDHVIARGANGKLYKINHAVKDGSVQFGDPQEIEQADGEQQQY